jgi:hypothetical protein
MHPPSKSTVRIPVVEGKMQNNFCNHTALLDVYIYMTIIMRKFTESLRQLPEFHVQV